MSLPITNLDDRKFQDLVDEAKRKIPELCPQWTNHNLSDPGVALIELFAWMTETMLFRLNQVPDVFYTRMLNLLGFDSYPATAARVDLTFWCNTETNRSVTIPAGTEVSTVGSVGATRVFTTLEPTAISAPQLVTAMTSLSPDVYTDVWEDLTLGFDAVPVFPRTPMAPGDSFYLGFAGSLAGTAIRLDIEAPVKGHGVIPDRPPLVWEAWQGEGWVPVTIPDVTGDGSPTDTTGGLNRNGYIVMLIPKEHEPLTLGGVRAYWLRATLIAPSIERPAYLASPEVKRVRAIGLGGTVLAEHSQLLPAENLGRSTGKPDQIFECSRTPVLTRTPLETLSVITADQTQTWIEVPNFADSKRDDPHFMWDSATGQIRFGPLIRDPQGGIRQHGAIPPEGAQLRLTGYRTGGGDEGNVGAGTITGLRSSIAYVTGVRNLTPSTGGVDAESVSNAKQRGPQTLRAGERAVTVSDFERLAQEADGRVARVRCLPPVRDGEAVRLLMVPKLRERPDGAQLAETLQLDDFALPDDLYRAVGDHLDQRRILGSRIEIGTPYYQGVTVAALLTAQPNRPPSLVRDRAMRRLYDFVNPLTGGPDGTGWPFDADLNSALVYQTLEAVEGVGSVNEVLFFEYDLRNHERVGFAKELVKLAPDSLFLSASHQVVVR